jgi:hypothetical protein
MLAALCYKHVNLRLISSELPMTAIASVLGPRAKTAVAIKRPHRTLYQQLALCLLRLTVLVTAAGMISPPFTASLSPGGKTDKIDPIALIDFFLEADA